MRLKVAEEPTHAKTIWPIMFDLTMKKSRRPIPVQTAGCSSRAIRACYYTKETPVFILLRETFVCSYKGCEQALGTKAAWLNTSGGNMLKPNMRNPRKGTRTSVRIVARISRRRPALVYTKSRTAKTNQREKGSPVSIVARISRKSTALYYTKNRAALADQR